MSKDIIKVLMALFFNLCYLMIYYKIRVNFS